jgi:hypothetical protein
MFTYDRHAVREIARFTALGVAWGAISGALLGIIVTWLQRPLLVGLGLSAILFLALFPSEKTAKTLYWPLAITLQATGISVFGLLGALGGLGLWVAALTVVPWLRYVLQRDNIVSVCTAALVAWLLSILIWRVGLVSPGTLATRGLLTYIWLGVLIGCIFWGLAKVISSSFKEYHFRRREAS